MTLLPRAADTGRHRHQAQQLHRFVDRCKIAGAMARLVQGLTALLRVRKTPPTFRLVLTPSDLLGKSLSINTGRAELRKR